MSLKGGPEPAVFALKRSILVLVFSFTGGASLEAWVPPPERLETRRNILDEEIPLVKNRHLHAALRR